METNFKVDVPSFALGFNTGKKNAKKPVLTELTVTENGVYDEPVIEGEQSITWDGVVGDKPCVYADEAKTSAYVKVSDVVLSVDDFVGAVMTAYGGTQFVITEDFLVNVPDVGVNCAALILSIRDADAFDAGMGLTFPEEGTYFNISFASGAMNVESLTFSAPTPADGWNKVTVNVQSDPVVEKDVNFYDYDGTLLHSYTMEEAQALTELPEFPEREGLTYQEWNWSLEDIKAYNRPVDVGAICISSDGATRIYIRLGEGRTSPIFGMAVNGTVTVDWGDGTPPDTLTGTSESVDVWTPRHNYANAGDYVIKLTIEGKARLSGLRDTSGSNDRNYCYFTAIRKVIIGEGITYFTPGFRECYNLESINIPNTITSAGANIFNLCRSLRFCAIPSSLPVTSSDIFSYCDSLKNVSLPSNFAGGLNQVFKYARGLKRIILPDTITSIKSNAFQNAEALETVVFSKNIKSISSSAFSYCQSLRSIELPQGITTVTGFSQCYVLASVVFPPSVTSITGGAFINCNGLRYADFSKHTAVPAINSTNVFQSNATDFEIRVPAALYDEWIAATNWSAYASKIVAV